jgi:hypothetical protein
MIIRRWLGGLAVLYLIACILPAYLQKGMIPGFFCLILLPYVIFYPAWWANPLSFAGWMALSGGNTRLSCLSGIVASALALSILVFDQPGQPHIGAYFWIGSMLGLAASGVIPMLIRFSKPSSPLLDEPPH